MRDFRDAKAMAQSLRETMSTRQIALTHGETLEIVSKMLGLVDWNTLSALIVSDREPAQPKLNGHLGAILPAFPIKDLVPFPAMQLPLWIKRPKTIQALSKAFSSRREIVLVAQKSQSVEEPGRDDVYDVGVIALVLDVGLPSDDMIVRSPVLEGSTQVLLQTQGRVNIRKFSGQAESYEANIELIDEGPIPKSPELIERAATLFDLYIAAHDIVVPPIWPPIRQLNDPGRVADLMVQRLPLALELRQAVLDNRSYREARTGRCADDSVIPTPCLISLVKQGQPKADLQTKPLLFCGFITRRNTGRYSPEAQITIDKCADLVTILFSCVQIQPSPPRRRRFIRVNSPTRMDPRRRGGDGRQFSLVATEFS